MSLSNNFPTVSPTLNLNFAAAGRLDSRVTFTRSSTATYTNQIGLIQSAAVNEPRFDYNPSTLAARGLLIEESRTNLLTYSEDITQWSVAGGSRSSNTAVSPDGQTTADTYTQSTGGDYLYHSAAISSSTTYTLSVFLKAGTKTTARLWYGTGGLGTYVFIDINISAGTIGSVGSGGGATAAAASIQAFGNGWYRVALTGNLGANTVGYLVLGNDSTSGGVYIWGAQLEQGSFSTSYIPTQAATVTRSADVASVNTLSPWYNSVEGSFFVEADVFSTSSFWSSLIEPNLSSNLAGSRFSLGVFSSTVSLYALVSNSVTVSGISSGGAMYANNAVAKTAFAYKLNDYAISGNGAAVATDTSSAVPTIDQIMLGNDNEGRRLNGHLRRITYYSARLTNAQLQALTL